MTRPGHTVRPVTAAEQLAAAPGRNVRSPERYPPSHSTGSAIFAYADPHSIQVRKSLLPPLAAASIGCCLPRLLSPLAAAPLALRNRALSSAASSVKSRSNTVR